MPGPVFTIPKALQLGDSGPLVRLAQEWLSLTLGPSWPVDLSAAPPACPITGVFGPETADAVRRLERKHGLVGTGVLDPELFGLLTAPMLRAMRQPLARADFAATLLACAEVHLKVGPREVGKQNGGPWVRYYCGGAEVSWCAGFVSTLAEQAARLLQISAPFKRELACDLMALDARRAGTFVAGVDGRPPAGVKPGSLFLVRAKPGNLEHKTYHHVGIVTELLPDRCFTVEGNTNEGGSPNGFGVFARTRSWRGLDFISI